MISLKVKGIEARKADSIEARANSAESKAWLAKPGKLYARSQRSAGELPHEVQTSTPEKAIRNRRSGPSLDS